MSGVYYKVVWNRIRAESSLDIVCKCRGRPLSIQTPPNETNIKAQHLFVLVA